MLESLMEKVIMKILGDYVLNFKKESIKLGIWSGHVCINDI